MNKHNKDINWHKKSLETHWLRLDRDKWKEEEMKAMSNIKVLPY